VLNYVYAFVPMFVAVDALGVLPLFMGLTEGLDRQVRRRIVIQSLITAVAVAVGFIFLGRTIFYLMGIKVDDFKVAGGVLLFIIAAMDLVTERKFSRRNVETIGAVPLGMPLIVGPAALTTSLMLEGSCGLAPTLVSVVANIGLAGVVFLSADYLTRLLGAPGSRALSKVAALILAAIAVMMIRRGLTALIAEAIQEMAKAG
jgi:multiple antibiotic resistance protein